LNSVQILLLVLPTLVCVTKNKNYFVIQCNCGRGHITHISKFLTEHLLLEHEYRNINIKWVEEKRH